MYKIMYGVPIWVCVSRRRRTFVPRHPKQAHHTGHTPLVQLVSGSDWIIAKPKDCLDTSACQQ